MRLPLCPPRRLRLMRPLAALLLALLMPAPVWAAPEGQTGTTQNSEPALADTAAQVRAENKASTALTAPPRSMASSPAATEEKPSLNIPEGGLALLPFLDFLLDPSGKLDISQVSAAERAQDFRRFENHTLHKQAGTLWLRFHLAPASSASATVSGPAQTRLDLGDQTPGKAAVWTRTADHPPVPAEAQEGLFSLAGLSGGGDVFVRMDGLPGLWFAPALRTVSDSLSTPDRRVYPLLLAALTALLLLCLMRSVTERGEGRLWTTVLIGAALLHALWGVPSTPNGTVMALSMPGLLAAGVALMLLPHIGRNIMRTRDGYPRLDMLLLVLALPGAALALLPLLPGLAWTARLVSLWPLGAVFALLPALILLIYDTPGSALFSLACLGLVTGGGLAVWGVNQGLAAPLWGYASLAGVVFAVLLLAAAAPRPAPAHWTADTDETPSLDTQRASALALKDQTSQDTPPPLRLEEILRPPLDTLLREACLLDQILDQPDDGQSLGSQNTRQARRHTDNLVAAVREMSTLVSGLPRLGRRRSAPENKHQVFDVLRLVQSVFADVSDTLQKGNLGLSWYIAPHLGRLYKGDRDRLRFVLSMLLENAARATDRGAVSLRVRRVDMSSNPGHLQFTVADTGSGTPPLRRSSLTLAKAWELAADHGGELFVDSTPHGVEISFSLNCVALTDDEAPLSVPPAAVNGQREEGEPNPRLVILASPRPLARQLLAFFLGDQGQDIWEARDAEEAAALYSHSPAALVIFDGHLPEEGIVTAVAAIRAFEGERSLPATPFLALTRDEEQAERLCQAGCDHSLPVPVTREEFRAVCLRLVSPAGAVPYRLLSTRSSESRPVSPSIEPEPAEARTEAPSASPPEHHASDAPAHTAAAPAAAPADAEPDAGHAARIIPADTATAASHSQAAAPAGPTVRPRPSSGQVPASALTPPLSAEAHPLPSPGLRLPPKPRERLGWLSSLFKPTPHIAPPDPLEDILPDTSSEWVGEPMPIAASPQSTPDVSQAAAPPLEDPVSEVSTTASSASEPDIAQVAAPLRKGDGPHDAPEAGGEEAPPAPDTPPLAHLDDSPAPDTLAEPMATAPGRIQNSACAGADRDVESADSAERISKASPAAEDRLREHAAEEAAGGTAPPVSSASMEQADTPPLTEIPARQAASPHTAAKGRHKHGGKHKRRKNRMDNVPFLSLNRADTPEPVKAPGTGEITRLELHPSAGHEPGDSDIVELTEADMVNAPLIPQMPDVLCGLDADMGYADSAMEHRNAEDLTRAADQMARRAVDFGLHALADLALCLKEAAQQGDFETVAQLLPELRAEVARHRNG